MPTTWLPPRGWRVSRTAWAAGSAVRRSYGRRLEAVVERPVTPARALACDVVSFSCDRDVPEQVASLRSLLQWAGRPVTATVVSDGTHTARSRALLERVDRSVRVVDWRDVAVPALPAVVLDYARTSPMGKKLAVELSLQIDRPLLYVDADVLLMPAAAELAGLLGAEAPRYLLDPEDVYLDPRLLEPGELVEPLNAGFLLLPRPLDWACALERLARLDGAPSFHTEQTLVHLAVRAAGGTPLDPQRWVVATDDMPALRDGHRWPSTVLRHYTTPVRHKFWLAVLAQARAGAAGPAPDRAP